MIKRYVLQLKRKAKYFLHSFKKIIYGRDNKTVFYAVSLLLLILIFLSIAFLFVQSFEKSEDQQIEQIKEKNIARHSEASNEKAVGATLQKDFYTEPEGELSKLIQKANILYNDGRVKDALEIFKNIALYSQTLANYNLGVIHLGEGRYVEANQAFELAIEGGDDTALSALNASYGALKMKDINGFNRFLNLADQTLADSAQSPFYSYLYALVSFYKNQYFETLSPLLHPNSDQYTRQSHTLASEMFLVLGDDYRALEYLKKDDNIQNALALGMLYARNGDYNQAQNKIKEFLQQNPNHLEALSALELIALKRQNYSEASSILGTIEKDGKPFFKIKTGLNQDLFDVNKAQMHFWKSKFESRRSFQYKILFYYAPYKVFDVGQTFEFLSEGGFEQWMHNVDEAKDSYIRGETFSRINRDIAIGLREVYAGDLRRALQIFLKQSKSGVQHAVLHYNIGLLYAQLGDFENAYFYFSKAYHLNNKDLMAGIFALMAGNLVYQDVSRLADAISGDFANIEFQDEDQKYFLSELFSYVRGGEVGIDISGKKPIYVALQAIGAIKEGDLQKNEQYFSKLKEMYPKDLTTEVMYQVAKNYGRDLKEVSLEFSEFFRKGGFSNMHSLYYGGSLTKELYIYLAFITGNLSFVITHLQNQLSSEEGSPIGTMQALGLAYVYNQEFEKAFVVYNDLVDNLGENDVRTKFMGAVAAIGAGHYNNAVALLQISKIDSIATLESRYALALLYQQSGNLKSAISLFNSIANKGFVSEFFDFKIDTSEILQKAQE